MFTRVPSTLIWRITEQWKVVDYRKMDAEALKQLMLDRIQELEQRGLVDDHFRMSYSLKEDNGLYFFLNVISIFFSEFHRVVKDMTTALDQPVVDFAEMYSHCIKLKGSSACIGAFQVRDACSNLRHAIKNKLKEECIRALDDIKGQFKNLHDQLDSIVKLEQEIVSRASPGF